MLFIFVFIRICVTTYICGMALLKRLTTIFINQSISKKTRVTAYLRTHREVHNQCFIKS